MATTLTCPRCRAEYGHTKDGAYMALLNGTLGRIPHHAYSPDCPQCGVPMRRHVVGPQEDASPSHAEVVING